MLLSISNVWHWINILCYYCKCMHLCVSFLVLQSFDALQIVRIKYQLVFNVNGNLTWKVSIYILSMNFDVKRIMFNIEVTIYEPWTCDFTSFCKSIFNKICQHSLSNKEHVFQVSSVLPLKLQTAKPFCNLIIKYLTKVQREREKH